ncbi:MAG TPA: sporulation protein [Oligoflexus sp.]|uniref:sporulation protein n=1 Tax=Oligoflexus sp. TaxID=1971216 RepID=UPI002D3B2414|nr:sporulation protein [Oligoflexus sp.]HYX32313.1 sporulation protein [Oligoflexus sp.]
MVFGRILASVGIGGAKVDTKISNPNLSPGGMLRGTVNLLGGAVDQAIERIDIALETYAKREVNDGETQLSVVIGAETVASAFQIRAGQTLEIPFEVRVPWDIPLNYLYQQDMPVSIFLRTHVHLANAVDSGDRDPVRVSPLPAQQLVLDAMARMGFRLTKVDVEYGQITGARLPFFQEIEFRPGSNYAGRFNEVEVTFVNRPQDMDVILEVDRRARGFQAFLGGHEDQIRRFRVAYADAERTNFETMIERTLFM